MDNDIIKLAFLTQHKHKLQAQVIKYLSHIFIAATDANISTIEVTYFDMQIH